MRNMASGRRKIISTTETQENRLTISKRKVFDPRRLSLPGVRGLHILLTMCVCSRKCIEIHATKTLTKWILFLLLSAVCIVKLFSKVCPDAYLNKLESEMFTAAGNRYMGCSSFTFIG